MSLSSETTENIEPKEKVKFGGRANKTGNRLEQFIEDILKREGYEEFWDHKEQVFANRKAIGGKQYAKQVVIGDSIYGNKVRCDVLVLNKEKFPDGLVIECKWQQSSGSVDVKFPYNVFNIAKLGVPTIILIDGGGYSKKSIEWLRGQAAPERALIGVYSMSEFQTKVNNGFLS
jgi:hypothetical protein